MRTYLECIPCFMNQTLRVGRMVSEDEKQIKRLLDEVGMMIQDIPLAHTPPETARFIYGKIKQITGKQDLFGPIKEACTRNALLLYPGLKHRLKAAKDPLLTAIRIAIAGNIIDFGVGKKFNVEQELAATMTRDFAILDYRDFQEDLAGADRILYIGDNAGETVFDRVLIEELGKPVTYVVRAAPIINDATAEDARQAGIDRVAAIMSSGCEAPGTILHLCSEEFLKIYRRSPLIISKGQGNYEGLSREGGKIYYLLQVKCQVIARDIGAPEGSIILKRAVSPETGQP